MILLSLLSFIGKALLIPYKLLYMHYLYFRVNWIEINGITYKPSCMVLLCFQHDMPVFGRIIDIFVYQKCFYLATQVHITYVFNQHYHAYEVSSTSTIHITSCTSLQDYHPLWTYQSYSQHLLEISFIPLKYYVLSDMD